MSSRTKTAIIIGAGPGGLTAAYELLTRTTDILPIVIEADVQVGGISRTVVYKGNRIDIGGHRFFSKSDRVMDWWKKILPIARGGEGAHSLRYRGKESTIANSPDGPDPDSEDRVMLIRPRKSRIYFMGQFFDYPISPSLDTFMKMGFIRTMKIGFSYIRAALFPYRSPKNLEEFYINKFGRELYATFFQSYTEKVWGVPCREISAEWGAQRVKGLSLRKAITHFFGKLLHGTRTGKDTETSLIEEFLYPKFGPGHLWETVQGDILKMGGQVRLGTRVVGLHTKGATVESVTVEDEKTGKETTIKADYVISTMPIKDLAMALDTRPPKEVYRAATGLMYRDFITVGLLLKKLRVAEDDGGLIKDNWIYIQEPGTLVGRIQVFNNWSPYMVADPETVWIGLEYFCGEGDKLWTLSDAEMTALGVSEMHRIGLIEKSDVLDSVVIRMKKTYPGYFGVYKDFPVVRDFFDRFTNLFLVGRNGMHKYNNQDHSMLTAMISVDNIISGRLNKDNVWAVNTEEEYHEAKKEGA